MPDRLEEVKKDQSPLRFPCQFPIKAIGLAKDGFKVLVVGILRQHVSGFDEGAVRTRSSSGGKYLSVTCTIEATSREQLDAIYRDLSTHKRVKWAI